MAEYIFVPTGGRVVSDTALHGPLFASAEALKAKPAAKKAPAKAKTTAKE